MQSNEMWNYLSSYWNNAENKEIIEDIWDGISFCYKFYESELARLENAFIIPEMVGHYDMDLFLFDKTADTMFMGKYLTFEKMSSDMAGLENVYEINVDYTISNGKIIFSNPPSNGIYFIHNVKLNFAHFVYEAYYNIFDYYPVRDTDGLDVDEYVYAIKPMLHAYRYGYTKNNLTVALNAIVGSPYTVWGGKVAFVQDGYIYIDRGAQYDLEKIKLNGYAANVNAGDTVKPMVLLADSVFTIQPYDPGGDFSDALREGMKASTYYIIKLGTPLTDVEKQFAKCFLDAVLPAKYNYAFEGEEAIVEEEVIIG